MAHKFQQKKKQQQKKKKKKKKKPQKNPQKTKKQKQNKTKKKKKKKKKHSHQQIKTIYKKSSGEGIFQKYPCQFEEIPVLFCRNSNRIVMAWNYHRTLLTENRCYRCRYKQFNSRSDHFQQRSLLVKQGKRYAGITIWFLPSSEVSTTGKSVRLCLFRRNRREKLYMAD